MAAHVLVVDDDAALLRMLRIGLQALGYTVTTATTGEGGISQAALVSPDVVVLDLGLPDIDGLTVCRRIRQWSDMPIIVLSAEGAEDRKIAALDGGADDYVTKPFGMGELEARLRVALRHRRSDSGPEEHDIEVGPLRIDVVHQEAELHGGPVELTSRELALLTFLARNAGKVCTHRMILHEVWGPAYDSETQYLRVYTYRLRRKLHDDDGRMLQTVPGIGYRLVDPSST